MTRIQGILAAGTLTIVVLAAVLAFGGFDLASAGGDDPAAAEPTPLETQQADQQQFEETLSVMQQREAEYDAQLLAANETIARLQEDIDQMSQPALAPQAPAANSFDDDRDDDFDDDFDDRDDDFDDDFDDRDDSFDDDFDDDDFDDDFDDDDFNDDDDDGDDDRADDDFDDFDDDDDDGDADD